jgi:hypothetical protein
LGRSAPASTRSAGSASRCCACDAAVLEGSDGNRSCAQQDQWYYVNPQGMTGNGCQRHCGMAVSPMAGATVKSQRPLALVLRHPETSTTEQWSLTPRALSRHQVMNTSSTEWCHDVVHLDKVRKAPRWPGSRENFSAS